MKQTGISEGDMPKATLKIEVSTRDRLKKLGNMEDTFDSVICKLLDEHDEMIEKQPKKD
jgi:hypothetical protein